MIRKPTLIITLLCLFTLSACESPPTRQDTGMVIGGVIGGILGAHIGKGHGRTTAIIIGTLIGAKIGGEVGRSMDDTDRMKTARSLETVRTGVPSSWRNPDSGNVYTVTPTKTYSTASGPCREYTIDAKIGGKAEKVYGTACRQPDGSWQVRK